MIVYAIDDEKAALYFLEQALQAELPGQEIVTFTNPLALLEAYHRRPADVVFMDIEMPGMTGIELAKALEEIKEESNIVFVTGYGDYAMDALNVFASGYVMKPCSQEKIHTVLGKLRYPVAEKKIFVKTFGNFELFYKGVPVKIRSAIGKELLAILVDREGTLVSRQEVAATLFEDDFSRTRQAQLTHIANNVQEDLKQAGMQDFFFIENGYRVDLSICDCDAVEFIKGNAKYPFRGEYMEQYSWGEYRKASFEGVKH